MQPVRLCLAVTFAITFGCGPAVPKDRYFKGQPVSHWLEALRNPDPKARQMAADVLGNVGPSDPLVVPALIEAIKDKNAKVRDAAVLSLSRIGPDAAEAGPALRALLNDPDPLVRSHVQLAVERVRPKS